MTPKSYDGRIRMDTQTHTSVLHILLKELIGVSKPWEDVVPVNRLKEVEANYLRAVAKL